METTCLFSTPLIPTLPCLSTKIYHRRKMRRGKRQKGYMSKKVLSLGRSDSYEWDCKGRVVDENMIVLRKRTHVMKMIERNYEPPADCMNWEKQCYTSYDENICRLVGFLQSYLMNTRPSLAIGMMMLITMSVPASTLMIVLRLMEIAS